MVLLKNDGVLPIAEKGKKIAVIGPHAGYARKMFGGYTHMCMMESTYAIANSIAGVKRSCNRQMQMRLLRFREPIFSLMRQSSLIRS